MTVICHVHTMYVLVITREILSNTCPSSATVKACIVCRVRCCLRERSITHLLHARLGYQHFSILFLLYSGSKSCPYHAILDRCNSGRPYPAADLTKGESPCEKVYGCATCKAVRGTPELATSQLGGRPYQLYGGTKYKAAQRTPDLQSLQLAAFLGTFDWQIFAPILHSFYFWRRSTPSSYTFDWQILAPTPHPFGWQTIMFFHLSGR